MPKLLTVDDVKKVIKNKNALWVLTEKRLYSRLDSFKRKEYWLRCQCGHEQWVRWARLQQGKSLGCRSCRSRLKKHGKRFTVAYQMWHDMHKKARRHNLQVLWKTLEEFEFWLDSMDWQKGFKLVRIDLKQGWGPDNCDLVLIRKTKSVQTADVPKLISGLVN